MIITEDNKTSRQIKKKTSHLLYGMFFLILLFTNPATIMSDDTFCTESWADVFFNDYIGGALRPNGRLFAWGKNTFGGLGFGNAATVQTTPRRVGSTTDFWDQISMGQFFTIGLKNDSSVFGWGTNGAGNLGANASTQFTPVALSALGNCTYVAAAGKSYNTYAVDTTGRLWAMGDNLHAQLGVPTSTIASSSTPLQIGTDTDWASVFPSPIDSHVCAKKSNNSLYCWGENGNFQVGDNTATDRPTPSRVGTLANRWMSVGFGLHATIALRNDGALFGFGTNDAGVLAQPLTTAILSNSTRIANPLTFKEVAVSTYYVIAIASDNTIYGWGTNDFLQVNSNAAVPMQMLPNQISSAIDWKNVYVSLNYGTGGGSVFAIKTDKSLYGWGQNDVGQLGLGISNTSVGTPTQIMPGRLFKSVSAVLLVAGAIDNSNQLFISGSNQNNQLGDGTSTNSTSLVSCVDRSLICSSHICVTSNCGNATTCATCDSANTSYCVTCLSSYYFLALNHTCVNPCPNGYFGDNSTSTATCVLCDSSCFTCTGPSNTSCTACNGSNYFLASNNSCGPTCPNATFPDNSTNICTACDISCATCANASNTGCLTCPPTSYFLALNNSCHNPCPAGYYGDNTTSTALCLACHSTCDTCSGAGPTNCTTCDSLTPKKVLVNNSCVATCPNGTFDNGSNTCPSCDNSCKTCSNSTNTSCLSCSAPFYFLSTNNSCVNPCPGGYHPENSTRTCELGTCHVSCATCNASTPNICNTCASGFPYHLGPLCYPVCQGQYVRNQLVCTEQCHASCNGCSGSTVLCLQCASGFVRAPSGLCVSQRMVRLRNLEAEESWDVPSW